MMLKARNLAAVVLGAALLLPSAAMAGSSYGSGYGNNYDRDYDRDQFAHGGSYDWSDYKKSPYGYDDDAYEHAKKYSKKQYKKHLKKQHATYPSRHPGQGNHYGWRKNSHKKPHLRYVQDDCRRLKKKYSRQDPYSRSAQRACRDGRHDPRSRHNPYSRHDHPAQKGHYGHNHVHQHSHHQAQQSDIYRLTHYVLREILEKPRY